MPIKHILVVDDSKSARLMLRKMLQALDLSVDMAESAEGALDYLRDRHPDAIFMDHTMPGMDGLEALKRIKRNPITARIPIAMYTSKDEPTYQDEVQAAGAVGVLMKPAMPETLGDLLDKMNAAFDKPVALTEAMSLAPAVGVSLETVEKIALAKAESVFYEAVESQVLPLMNDVVGKLQHDIQASMEATIDRVATRVCEAKMAELRQQESGNTQAVVDAAIREQVPLLLDERLAMVRRDEQAKMEVLSREIAVKVCQSQLNDLSERLVRQLSARFIEATHKASEAAQETATQVARQVAAEAAREALTTAREVIEQRASEVAGRSVRDAGLATLQTIRSRIFLSAGLAAAIGVGVGAALAVYGLR